MAEHTRKLHFKDSGDAEHTAQLYTAYGDVLPPEIQLNADGTTGGITLYTTGNDTNYPALRVKDGNDTVFGALVDPQDGRASNLHCEYQGTEYAVAEQVKDLSSVGICLVQTGGGSGTWAWVDENGNALNGIDLTNKLPWSGITNVTIDGEAMVKIPRFYIKTGTFASGTYSGKKYWLVSQKALNGYRIHPAFCRRSKTFDAFYIGAYEAYDKGNNVFGSAAGKGPSYGYDFEQCKSYGQQKNTDESQFAKSGWHMSDVYERAAINLLLMIDMKTPDAQTACGHGETGQNSPQKTGATNAVWRGIHEWWGNTWQWEDGIRVSNGYYQVFNNVRTAYVATTQQLVNSGWPTNVSSSKGEEYNLADLFIPSSLTDNESQATIPDEIVSSTSSNPAYFITKGGLSNFGNSCGPFTMNLAGPSNTTYCNFRLAKDGNTIE